MILTVTLNPSIDISYPLDESFKLDTVNRVSKTSKTAGGKGLNVTRVLSEVGEDVVATGLIGGRQGQYLIDQLEQKAIKNQFYQIKGETRNCIAILYEGLQTEILESGPFVDKDEADGFMYHMQIICRQYDVLTISGSLPKGLDNNYYQKIISLANSFQKKVVLDCSGPPLLAVLESAEKPTVIKPNIEELELLLNKNVDTTDLALKKVLSEDIFDGVEWVIVSLGAKGSFAKHNNKFYRISIPKITVKNPVGSGDSTVAGIAWGLSVKDDDITLLKKANTLGMLNAQEALTGHVNMGNYFEIFNNINIEEV